MHRLWNRVSRGENGCWQWTGWTQDGYGRLTQDGRKVRAHRLVYELLIGPIPEGLVIDHLCRNRACVNPNHLDVVEPYENTLRGLPYRRAAVVGCKRGHPFDEANTLWFDGRRYCRTCRRLRRRAERAAA